MIDEGIVKATAQEDWRKDLTRQHVGSIPEVWRQWQAKSEQESDKIAAEYKPDLLNAVTTKELLEAEIKNAENGLNSSHERQESEIRDLDSSIEKTQRELANMERDSTLENIPSIGHGWYKFLLLLFGILEIPLNWIAFQSLELSNVIIVGAVTIVVGAILAMAAHRIGRIIKQIPPVGRSSSQERNRNMREAIFWLILVIGLYLFVTMFREVSLNADSIKMFLFMMLINTGLFAIMVGISRAAHHVNQESHDQMLKLDDALDECRDKLKKLKKKRKGIEEECEEEDSKSAESLAKNQQKLIAVNGEIKRIFHEATGKQEQVDNNLQIAIRTYVDEYTNLHDGSNLLPDWANGDKPLLHISILQPDKLDPAIQEVLQT